MKDNKELKVVNFFGGPGVGKSTASAGVFYAMKVAGFSVELVTEFAKDIIYEEHWKLFPEQDFLLAQQNRRLRRLVKKVEYAVTDSPLAMSTAYTPDHYPESFNIFCIDLANSYSNLNIFLKRTFDYVPVGRRQNEASADAKSAKVKAMLDKYNIVYIELESDITVCSKVLTLVTTHDWSK